MCGSDDDCNSGMACMSGTCVAFGDENTSCDSTHPCRPDLTCKGSACTAPSAAGVACSSPYDCDGLRGVVCNPSTMKCENVGIAAPGAACGILQGHLIVCMGPGGFCAGATSPNYQGTCVAAAADGAACDVSKGPVCSASAVCVSGACVVPDPGMCH
jgi:hypothetical protein